MAQSNLRLQMETKDTLLSMPSIILWWGPNLQPHSWHACLVSATQIQVGHSSLGILDIKIRSHWAAMLLLERWWCASFSVKPILNSILGSIEVTLRCPPGWFRNTAQVGEVWIHWIHLETLLCQKVWIHWLQAQSIMLHLVIIVLPPIPGQEGLYESSIVQICPFHNSRLSVISQGCRKCMAKWHNTPCPLQDLMNWVR